MVRIINEFAPVAGDGGVAMTELPEQGALGIKIARVELGIWILCFHS